MTCQKKIGAKQTRVVEICVFSEGSAKWHTTHEFIAPLNIQTGRHQVLDISGVVDIVIAQPKEVGSRLSKM